MGKKGTPHRRFSKEEKLRIVKMHLDEHKSIMQIERETGIGNSLVSAWVKKYLEEGEEALEPHSGNPYAALYTSKSLSEVERLGLIVAKQEVEVTRLKKGYWVEGVGASKEYVTGSGKTFRARTTYEKKTIPSVAQSIMSASCFNTVHLLIYSRKVHLPD